MTMTYHIAYAMDQAMPKANATTYVISQPKTVEYLIAQPMLQQRHTQCNSQLQFMAFVIRIVNGISNGVVYGIVNGIANILVNFHSQCGSIWRSEGKDMVQPLEQPLAKPMHQPMSKLMTWLEPWSKTASIASYIHYPLTNVFVYPIPKPRKQTITYPIVYICNELFQAKVHVRSIALAEYLTGIDISNAIFQVEVNSIANERVKGKANGVVR